MAQKRRENINAEPKRDKRIRKTPTASHVVQLVSSRTYIECSIYIVYPGYACRGRLRRACYLDN